MALDAAIRWKSARAAPTLGAWLVPPRARLDPPGRPILRHGRRDQRHHDDHQRHGQARHGRGRQRDVRPGRDGLRRRELVKMAPRQPTRSPWARRAGAGTRSSSRRSWQPQRLSGSRRTRWSRIDLDGACSASRLRPRDLDRGCGGPLRAASVIFSVEGYDATRGDRTGDGPVYQGRA